MLRDRSVLVVRAERDVTSLRITLRAERTPAPNAWSAKLFPSLDVAEPEPIPASLPPADSAVWSETVQGAQPKVKELSAPIPRREFKSWMLVLDPAPGTQAPLQVDIAAKPAGLQARTAWLHSVRLTFDPETNPDRVRDTIRYLSDPEVRYWTGFPSRRIFLHVWKRMTPEQIFAAYPEEARTLLQAGRRLPGGLSLLTNSRVGGAP